MNNRQPHRIPSGILPAQPASARTSPAIRTSTTFPTPGSRVNSGRTPGTSKTESLYNLAGDTTAQLIAALNEGRSFITYRGPGGAYWFFPFAVEPDTSWVNRGRTPILVGATCQTITLYPGQTMFGDASVRFGSPETLGGAVAYLGTSRTFSAVSQYRSAVYRGLFTGLFLDSITRLGPALERGRLHMDSLYSDSAHYEEWTLLGDPELNVWTHGPAHRRCQPPGRHQPGCADLPGHRPFQWPAGVRRSGLRINGDRHHRLHGRNDRCVRNRRPDHFPRPEPG